MNEQQQANINEQYQLLAKRIAEEQFKLFPEYEFDPVQLAHHLDLVLNELQRRHNETRLQRDIMEKAIDIQKRQQRGW